MNSWILGARPRTLPAAVVPVAIGAGCAVGAGSVVWWRVAVALVVTVGLGLAGTLLALNQKPASVLRNL